MAASGHARTPLAIDELPALAESLRREKVEALAISFINSYVDPAHEQLFGGSQCREFGPVCHT